MTRPHGLFGDLGVSQLDPGPLFGLPEQRDQQLCSGAFQFHGVEEPRGDPQLLRRDDTGLRDPGRVSASQAELPEVPQAPPVQETGFAEAPSLLRSWWDARPRRITPPPRSTPAEQQGAPVLEALARGVQQLQELQAQSFGKGILYYHFGTGSARYTVLVAVALVVRWG